MKRIIIISFIYLFYSSSFAQESIDTVFVIAESVNYGEIERDRAIKDISEGKVYIYCYGLLDKQVGNEKLEHQIDSLANVYGFKFALGGCLIPPGSESYYNEVMKYLNKRNGEGWKQRFDDEVGKLEKKFYSEVR